MSDEQTTNPSETTPNNDSQNTTPESNPESQQTPTETNSNEAPATLLDRLKAEATTDEQKAEAQAAEAAATLAAPTTLDDIRAAVPEGFEFNEERADAVLEAINGASTRTEMFQRLAVLQAEDAATNATALADAQKNVIADWETETRSHPDFTDTEAGNRNLAAVDELAENFGGSDFRRMLSATGLGSNVHMVSFLFKVYNSLPKEGGTVMMSPKATGPKSNAQKLFPDLPSKGA